MKLFNRILVSIALIAAGICLFSCDNDSEGFDFTGKNGLPSAFKTDNQTIYLSYSGNQLLKMMKKDGSTTSFNYEGNELRSVSFAPPADPNIADGHGSTDFEREGNKILVKSCGEPSLDVSYNQEIELDENGLPIKITDLGAFQMTSEGYNKIGDGKNYLILSFDSSTKNLLKLEIFNLEDSRLITTHTFTYNNQPGSMSQVELPLWFFSFWFQKSSYSTGTYPRQFLNHQNTLTEETITDGETGNTQTIHYKYTYNKSSYPVSVDNGEESMEIKY